MFYVCPNLAVVTVPLLVASSVTASCHSYSHVPSFVSILLSHVLCFVSASMMTPFLLSLMCLVTVLALSCALLCLNITPLLRCLRVSHCSCSLMCLALSQHHAALMLSQGITLLLLSHVPCFVWLSIVLLSQVLRLSITPLLVSA